MTPPPRALRDGLVAGLLAGVALAILFFFYDLGQGAGFRTPAFLWGAIVQGAAAEPTAGVIAGYTVLHFAAWGTLGVLAAFLIDWAGLPRNILIGAAYGLFACSLVFYVGLVRAPTELVLSAPGWPAVFFGNTLAGIVMFTHLHWVSTEPGMVGMVSFLQAHDVTRRGIVAGLLGAVVVAVWFLIVDSVLREPLFTPSALAAVLFEGGASPDAIEVGAGPALAYSIIHFSFFLVFGVALAAIVFQVEQFPPLSLGLIVLLVVFNVFFVSMVAVLGRWVLAEVAWWSIMAGNFLAAGAMGLYLWKAHPGLSGRLTGEALWAD